MQSDICYTGVATEAVVKERPKRPLGPWRLWAGFGDWEWTKVKDVVFESIFCKIYRACKEWHGWTGNGRFFDRLRLVHWLERRTIEEGWTDGWGPRGKPFWMCVSTELQGRDLAMEHPF